MSFERLDYSGNAVVTTVVGPVTATTLSWNIDDPTGWPLGTNGKFGAVFDRGGPNEEKVRCTTLTGSTVTVAGTSDRGADGTTPKSHAAAETFEHCYFAQDADEANLTGNQVLGQVTTKGDVLTGRSTQRLQRTPTGSNDALWICDSSQPGGMRFGSLPAGGINSAAQIADGIVTPAKLTFKTAWGYQADGVKADAGVDCSTSFTDVFSLAVPVLLNRRYRITAFCNGTQITSGPSTSRARVIDDQSGVKLCCYETSLAVNASLVGTGVLLMTPTSSRTITFKVQGAASAGAYRVATGNVDMLVEDIGPVP